jgi:hypothetical protein
VTCRIHAISLRRDQLSACEGIAVLGHADEVQACGLRGFLAFPHRRGFGLAAERDESTFGVNGFVGVLPEAGRDMLAAHLDVRDGAAAVADNQSELGLVVSGGAAVGR